jgi:hypothetical protein
VCTLYMMDDSPWDDDPNYVRETEWSKISNDFINVRYAIPPYARALNNADIRQGTAKG